MSRFLRGWAILWVVFRYGLDELVLSGLPHPWLRKVRSVLTFGRKLDKPRGQRLREALEELGPIFVKFGQVLSTRSDLMPPDVAEELAKLQDRVPPFDSQIASRSPAPRSPRCTSPWSATRAGRSTRWRSRYCVPA